MKEREVLVKAIKEEMQKVCTGWGVYLEAVEISEVLVSSSPLFKHLQADFRENIHQHAEMIKMSVDTELSKFKEEQNMELNKFRSEN